MEAEISQSISIEDQSPQTRAHRLLKHLAWFGLGFFFLIVFTVAKLPEQKIKNLVQGSISSALGSQGITFNATEAHLGIFLGLSYQMKDIHITLPQSAQPLHIDEIKVSPSLLSLVFGRWGGSVWVKNGDGTLQGSFSLVPNKATSSSNLETAFKLKQLDLGRLGALPIIANLQGTITLSGEGNFTGDPGLPSTWKGSINLTASKLIVDPQSIQGFTIPRLTASEAALDLNFDHGKATVKALRIGKSGSASISPGDDISGTLSGDANLGRQLESSTLNMKTKFRFSENLLKAFVLLDALIGGGKQPDGSYEFNINGDLAVPVFNPVGAT